MSKNSMLALLTVAPFYILSRFITSCNHKYNKDISADTKYVANLISTFTVALLVHIFAKNRKRNPVKLLFPTLMSTICFFASTMCRYSSNNKIPNMFVTILSPINLIVVFTFGLFAKKRIPKTQVIGILIILSTIIVAFFSNAGEILEEQKGMGILILGTCAPALVGVALSIFDYFIASDLICNVEYIRVSQIFNFITNLGYCMYLCRNQMMANNLDFAEFVSMRKNNFFTIGFLCNVLSFAASAISSYMISFCFTLGMRFLVIVASNIIVDPVIDYVLFPNTTRKISNISVSYYLINILGTFIYNFEALFMKRNSIAE